MNQSNIRATDLRTKTDSELLLAVARSRNESSFVAIYEKYKGPAFGLACRLTGSESLALEAVQDAMTRIWQRADTYQAGNARGWILKIVANQSLELLRQEKRQRRKWEMPPMSINRINELEDSSDRKELIGVLQKLLDKLPLREQQIIALYYGTGWSQEQIANHMAMPQRTVSHKLSKVKQKLSRSLAATGLGAAVSGLVPLMETALIEVKFPPHLAAPLLQNILHSPSGQNDISNDWSWRKWTPAVVGLLLGLVFALQEPDQKTLPKEPLETVDSFASSSSQASLILPSEKNSEPAAGTFYRFWDFSEPPPYQGLDFISGQLAHEKQWNHVKKGGYDDSECLSLSVGHELRIVFDLPIKRLPIFITCHTTASAPTSTSWKWTQYYDLAMIPAIGRVPSTKNSLMKFNLLVAKDHMVLGVNQAIAGIHFGKPKAGARFCVTFLCKRGILKIDNLEMREVDSSRLMNIDSFREVVAKIPEPLRILPPGKTRKRISLPWPDIHSKQARQFPFIVFAADSEIEN